MAGHFMQANINLHSTLDVGLIRDACIVNGYRATRRRAFLPVFQCVFGATYVEVPALMLLAIKLASPGGVVV